MNFLKYSLSSCSFPVRFFHQSACRSARGVRRSSDESKKNSQQHKFTEDESQSIPIQEEFARLELQRLTQQQNNANETVDETDEHEQQEDEENHKRPTIDPSTKSVLLFPGQGTQFVGMGSV